MDKKNFLLRYVAQNVYICTLSQIIIYIVSQTSEKQELVGKEERFWLETI
jgi:hypothetical protein